MVFIPFPCSLDNLQYFIVCNVPFLLDVFTNVVMQKEGESTYVVHIRLTSVVYVVHIRLTSVVLTLLAPCI